MFNLGMGEITVILLLALIFLGPSKLPELAAGLGKIIREIRKATSDVKNEIALDDTFRKPFEDLRDAVTLHPDELKRRDRVKQEVEEARRRMEEEVARLAAEGPAPEGPAPEGHGDAAGRPPTEDGSVAAGSVIAAASAEPTVVAPVPEPPSPTHAVEAGAHNSEATALPLPGVSPPAGAPLGTVARRARGAIPPVSTPTLPFLGSGPAPRAVPPTSSADRANATQILSEDDLIPSARPPAFHLPAAPAAPPPLPGSASGRVGPKGPPPGSKKS